MSLIKNIVKNLSPIYSVKKRKEKKEMKEKLGERKLKTKEEEQVFEEEVAVKEECCCWGCWEREYQHYLEYHFNYTDFNEIMKLPFIEDRIFYLDKLINNEVKFDDLVIGDQNLEECWLSTTGKDVDVLLGRKKVVTWGGVEFVSLDRRKQEERSCGKFTIVSQRKSSNDMLDWRLVTDNKTDNGNGFSVLRRGCWQIFIFHDECDDIVTDKGLNTESEEDNVNGDKGLIFR
ncbi:hypothetical protein Glove_159g17 [Diversispora epigaea]|uniref:Uncharacterized protein n=1 Tax=Diversispora epigaea TaxID=1348612 RepID=A0A397IRL5_9GLOM|nr:hypothetical protein Glove_159g17 [Diversispora epigaea]